MKKITTITIILCSIILFSCKLSAQDIHFSHISSVPTFLNPAMTGLFNSKVRLSSNYKDQWNAFTNGYHTMSVSADIRAYELKSSIIGGGLSLFSDKAGDLDLSTNTVSFSTSFIQLIGKNTWASLGFQNSLTQSRMDFSKIVAFEQEQTLLTDNSSYWDLSTGVAFMHQFRNDNLMNFGVAVFHINNPNVSFFNRKSSTIPTQYNTELLDRKMVLHGSADLKLLNGLYIRPSFIFKDQGPHREITMGSFVKYSQNLKFRSSDDNISLYFGAWMRWFREIDLGGADALITSVRMDFNNTFVTLSYDINVSSLALASTGQGGMELSVVKLINKKQKRVGNQKLKCPADYF